VQLNPYLSFNGQCEAAFRFYERCLGGKIAFTLTYAESPMGKEVPANWQRKIVHCRLMVGEQVLMGGDPPPERYEKPQGFSVTINVDSPSEAERIFRALSEKGTVHLPIQETFWALRFGMLVDQFGTPWMINCESTQSN